MDYPGVVVHCLFIGMLWQPVFSTCVNLTEGKHASQSSTLNWKGLWNADLALDGNTAFSESPLQLSCSGTADNAINWWQVDLDAVVAINRIEVFGRPTSPPYQLQGFQAFVSTKSGDRTPSTLVYTNVDSWQYNSTGGHFIIEMNTTMARYVSIELNINIAHVHTAGDLLPLVLCEVKVFFCDEILLTHNMITGSPIRPWGTTWANAIDGDNRQDANTCKCCGISVREINPQIQIDLGKRFKLSQITVYGRNDRADYRVDSLQLLHIYVHNSPTDKGDPVFIENSSLVTTVSKHLSPSKLGQYVTLQLQGNRSLVICEIAIKQEACPDFHYGLNCSLPCGNCKAGEQCDILTGYCSHCAAGHKLPLCQTECNPTTYGEDCKHMCGHCRVDDICNTTTGHCPNGCDDGYKTTYLCTDECNPRTYGKDCKHTCGHCKDDGVCDTKTGYCPTGCERGYKATDSCIEECENHKYGYNCTESCGHCLNNESCDKTNGSCISCAAGYRGIICKDECDNHTYGYSCTESCGHCWNNASCDKRNGSCVGCAAGYRGNLCKDECTNGTYGKNCKDICGGCREYDVCNFQSGMCPNSCEKGYKATALCNEECDNHTYGYNCSHSCGNCQNNSSCKKTDGACTRCSKGYKGNQCNDACPDHFYGNCSTPCGNCKEGIACDKTTGHCELGCASGFKNTSLCLEKLADADSSSQTAVAVAVGVTAAIAFAVAVLVAFFFYRRRNQYTKKAADASCSTNTFDNVEHVPEESVEYAKPTRKSRDSAGTQSVELATNGAVKEKRQQKNIPAKESSKDGHEYYNFAPLANALKACHLWSYIHDKKANECKLFYEEFKNLKKGLVEKHEQALDPANRGKNRYREMYAYDATRVVLEIDEEGATDYINACHINGYERTAKFIASQGPIKDMDVDFWRMVWQQNSTMIVMLTNLCEMGGEKCKKYWPDPDETEMTFGRIKVKTDSQANFGDFVIRRLCVSRDTERPRAVTQYHFRAWPDKDVPDTTWCLVNFWRRVMADDTGSSQTKPPIVVHCSAGIGRTGTFIALDNLYNQAKTEGCLWPFQVVEALRKQRVNMVQTREQYVYLHEAVADALLIGTHYIMAEQFKDVYTFLAGSDQGCKKSRLELQYALMEKSLSYQRSRRGGEGDYVYSNMLGNTDSEQDADGLKFTFWPDHNDVKSFVVTKKPTRATQDNFWSLVEQNQIRTFVIASSLDEASDKMSTWLGTGSDEGSFNVNYISKRKMDGFMEKNFSYCRKNKDKSYLTTVRQFELTTWGHERAPTDPKSVIRLCESVRSWQPHLKKEEPILIYCRTGSERSGLLFTVLSLLFKFEAENENTKLNILEKVMDVKQRDMAYIPNYKQYKFVHDVILEHMSQKEVSEKQVYMNYQE